jgi:prepilin-type N-terminal cleavage/methylation domain-containing protein
LRRRSGFSLLELVIAISLFSAVIAIAMQAFIGIYKGQGTTVGSAMLKTAGELTLKKMYQELTQSRRLLASLTTDVGVNMGQQYFVLYKTPTSGAFVPCANGLRDYPVIRPNGGLGVVGTAGNAAPGELDPATVGNMLVFVRQAKLMQVTDSNVRINLGVGGLLDPSTGAPYYLAAYQFVAYYPVQVAMPVSFPRFTGLGVPFNNVAVGYTYQLARWESQYYVDKDEFTAMTNKMVIKPGLTTTILPAGYVWADLVNNEGCVELWDSDSSTAQNAFYKVDNIGNIALDTNPGILQKRVGYAMPQDLAGNYGITFLSFNTGASFSPPGIDKVPAYADYTVADTPNPPIPFGFETAIVGPNSARSVLLRLAVACRLSAGGHLFGITNQEVVRVSDN